MASTMQVPELTRAAATTRRKKKIWIDLENSPHVPFFKPIIHELEQLGYAVTITARDCFQVFELADMAKFDYRKVGRHYGKNKAAKFMGLGIRTLQMAPIILKEKPDLAVSHGSRSSFVLANLLGIPNITIVDYEHAKWVRLPRISWVMAPEVIPEQAFTSTGIDKEHILRYPGIKEDVYTPQFRPNPAILQELGLQDHHLVVTIRPPATEAHYHNPESEKLLDAVLTRLAEHPDAKVVLVPRTGRQDQEIRRAFPAMFASGKFIVPAQVVDGLDLIWYSDLVISGGGTMNREAAALGVPVYSIFRGKLGSVDKYLSDTGRLVLLQSVDDVLRQLKLVRRTRSTEGQSQRPALQRVVENIVGVLEA